ncbi:hypothetical protein Tco_0964184 [Tanacetum coccineum]
MIERNGPKWLFDIDSLTQSMNYVPVAAGTITNETADASNFDSPSKDVSNGQPNSVADDQKQVKNGPHNESDEKDKSEDDSSPKEVNAVGQHVNTASLEVNTGRFELNIIDPSVNTASSYELDSPKDMFKLGGSHTLETTHVEFFIDEDEPEVDLGNITNSYTVPATPNTRIHKDYPIKNVIGDIEPTSIAKALLDSSWLEVIYLEKPLVKDGDADDVDVHLYRSMIGYLMYLTTSRPDIMFAILSYKRHVKRGRDTKIPQSSGPPVKVGDEAVHKELGDRMERAATTASSLEAEQDSDAQTGFETTSKQSNDPPLSRVNTLGCGEDIADEAAFTSVDVDAGGAATTDIGLEVGQGSGTMHKTPTRPHDSPLLRVYILGSDEGSLQQNESMDLVTKLTDRVKVLKNDMQQTKKGRKISEIDKDPTISLVQLEQDMEYDFDVSTAEGFTTASVPVTTASVTLEVSTAAANLVYIRRSAEKIKDKGKAIIKEDEYSDPTMLRYHALQNRSFSVAEDQNNAFVPKDSEIEKEVMKIPGFNFQQKSSKKRSREDSDEDNAKKQKLKDDAEKKELRDSMEVVLRDDIAIDVESLATKYPIARCPGSTQTSTRKEDEVREKENVKPNATKYNDHEMTAKAEEKVEEESKDEFKEEIEEA